MDMTSTADEPDVGRMRAGLLESALGLVNDPEEARALVALVLQAAGEQAPPLERVDLFRLLRQAYHSIGRSRSQRRMRNSAVTALAVGQTSSRPGPSD
jgi:hypothetical protein